MKRMAQFAHELGVGNWIWRARVKNAAEVLALDRREKYLPQVIDVNPADVLPAVPDMTAEKSFRSNCRDHEILARSGVRKISTAFCTSTLRLPAICTFASFSARLNAARSCAISPALEADFSISMSELRIGLFASILLSKSELCPRMLVSALLKSSATDRANCNAQSSFCLCAVDSDCTAASLINWKIKNFCPSRLELAM